MNTIPKVLIVSKLIFFDNKNELIVDNLKIADLFYSQGINVYILAKYSTIKVIKEKIPEDYKQKINFIIRNKESREKINRLKYKKYIFAVLGIVNDDAIFSFNCKIPLFNPEKLNSGRVIISEKVLRYGLPIIEFQNIIDCLKAYEIHKENYFHISFSSNFTVISLNNANTYYRPEEEGRIKKIFETSLKGGTSTRNQKILLILLFHLINEITSNPYFDKVDYWGTFPSSKVENTDTSVSFIKESVRKIVGGLPLNGPELLIRRKSMESKHISGDDRLKYKCEKDFDTLIVNPEIEKKIKGKTVCIIDDYITNGYSAEAAKHLLFKAEVKEIIFISFGKFGTKYYATEYVLEKDLNGNNISLLLDEKIIGSIYNEKHVYNKNNDQEILSFSEII